MYNNKQDFLSEDCSVAILPVGALEQHGSHLPVGTDTIITSAFAERIAKQLNAYLLPVLSITSSIEHRLSKGTVYISADTLSCIIRDIAESLQFSGFKKLVLVNGHGGNWILKPTIRQLNRDFIDQHKNMEVILVHNSVVAHRQLEVLDHVQHDLHGGEKETSLMMYLCKEHVKAPLPQDEATTLPQEYMDYFDISEITEDGYWGYPQEATEQKGAAIMELMVECAIDYLNELDRQKKLVEAKRLKAQQNENKL